MEVRGGSEAVDMSLMTPGLEIHVISRPYHMAGAGGDVHYVSSCGTGRITRLLLADVAGHGDDVAQLAGKLRDLMRRYINHIDARTLTTEINQQFSGVSTPGRFATALIGTFYAPLRQLTLVNAGHPPPVLFRAATRTWHGVEGTDFTQGASNLPLGVMDDTPYDQHHFELDAGDVLLAYTDSLSESKDATGELLTVPVLCPILPPITPGQSLLSWANDLTLRVKSMNESNMADDDTTFVLCRAVGGKTQASVLRRIAAVGKFARLIATRDQIPWPELTVRNLAGDTVHNLVARLRRKK